MAYVPGMPSNIPDSAKKKAQEVYQKQQEQKKSDNSSSSSKPSTSTSVPGMPSNVPTDVQQKAQESYNKQKEAKESTKSDVPGLPSNVPYSVRQAAQQNYEYITSLPTQSSLLTPDATKILKNTNTAKILNYREGSFQAFYDRAERQKDAYNALPTEVRQKIKTNMMYKNSYKIEKSDQFYQNMYKMIQASESEYNTRTLEDMIVNRFWSAGEYQKVSATTSQDYYRMLQSGYEVVYVESGSGKLQNKGGVYSIGRDKLAGLPHDVRTVLVTPDGEWKYIADTGSRASYVETIRTEQAARNAMMESKITESMNEYSSAKTKLEELNKQVAFYEKAFDKTRSQDDLDALQKIIEEYNATYKRMNAYQSNIERLGENWAWWYEYYDNKINDIVKWSVEDEARYQKVKAAVERADSTNIRNNIHDSKVADILASDTNLLSEYLELSKRREKAAGNPVFLDQDVLTAMEKQANNMQHAVQEFNKWDSVTIHTENGEDLGTQIKRFMLLELGYDDGKFDVNAGDLLRNPVGTIATNVVKNVITDEEYREDLKEAAKGTGEAIAKQVTPYILAHEESKRATAAYNELLGKINSGKLNAQEKADAELLLQGYLQAQARATSQANSIVFNNVISNLSVMDLYSVQSAFVTWRMAEHPERYSDDEKFKKLQDAYRTIYGEDYNGAMDSAHMVRVMLDIKKGDAGDYIYIDGSDLRHSNGEQYGTVAALGVGLLTDLSALSGLGKTAVEATSKRAATKALVKQTTDAYIQSLVRAEVAQDVAEEFIKSKAMQKAITKDVKAALRTAFSKNTDEFGKVLKAQLNERAKTLNSVFVDDLVGGLDEVRYARFLKAAEDTLNSTVDVAQKSLLLNKATVIASTLGGLDDVMDEAQRMLFKMTCPVAGGVSALVKGGKYIKELNNLRRATPETLAKLAVTQRQVAAKIAKLDFDACLNAGTLNALHDSIVREFHWGLLSDVKNKFILRDRVDDVVKQFCNYKDTVMRSVANSYVDSVITTLRKQLDGEKGIQALEELAANNNFKSFDEMFATIKSNIEVMYQHSPEAKGIVESFDNYYSSYMLRSKLNVLEEYSSNVKAHIKAIDSTINKKSMVFTLVNATENANFVQGVARELYNNVYDFLNSTDPELLYKALKDGKEISVFDTASELLSALNDVAVGKLDAEHVATVVDKLNEYKTLLDDVYVKNLDTWEANVIQDSLGVQNYCETINKIAANHAGNDETFKSIHDGLADYFKTHNIDFTESTIDQVLVDAGRAREFAKLSLDEQQALIYRITLNKGSNMINQINDDALMNTAKDLVDCNSQLNKNIRLLQTYLGNNADRIDQVISNASAMENTKLISDELLKSGVDSKTYIDIMDVMSGEASTINRIVQTNTPDEAAAKLRNFIMSEVTKQGNLHGGTYHTFRNLGADTVDVASNITNIEKHLDEYIPQDDQFIDITVSMVKSTDTAAPKDIAFHVRGSADDATVLRKNSAFTVYDDEFASRTYGRTSAQLNDAYEALGDVETLSSADWQKQLKEYIEQQKQIALEQNKTLRFIGFNSSDAISGGNKYLSDVLRSCGVNANTATALDLADIMRKKVGDVVYDSAHIEALHRGLKNAIDTARSRSISLDITPSIAYDSKYNCAQMLSHTLKGHNFHIASVQEHAKYILDQMTAIDKQLGTTAYNEAGLAMGAYLDATAFARILEDAGQSSLHSNNTLMKIITEATVRGDAQLGLHKVIETAMDNEWIDYSKIAAEEISTFSKREKVHESIIQINNIHKGLHRLDLITDSDLEGLKYIYKEMVESVPENSHAKFMTRLFKADELTAQQLYAVDRWLIEQMPRLMKSGDYKSMYSRMLMNAGRQASYLSDTGYKFVRNNIIDYTDDALDMFAVKYLDDSEEGYRFAKALNSIGIFKETADNLRNYNEAINGLFKDFNVHGVQDKLLLMQNAAVHQPIMRFHDSLQTVYNVAYRKSIKELFEETKNVPGHYTKEMADRIATERGARAVKQYIVEQGESARALSVQAVLDLDADSMKAHLIRNCGGGLIIDPSAKCVQGVDLVLLFDKWKKYGIKIDTIDFSNDIISNRKLFRISLPELNTANLDEIYAKYNHANIEFSNNALNKFNNGMRHSSFNASDMTIMDANHMDNFKQLFFGDTTLIDFHYGNFNTWADELYSCNMWTDMDLKQLVNPYYTDNMLNNLAQNTHQLRNNISAMHDLGSIINNRYMNSEYILNAAGVYNSTKPIKEQRAKIISQLTGQNQRLCKLTLEGNKIKVVDYTPVLKKANTSDKYFKQILQDTVMLDDSMYTELADWSKTASIALRMQASNAPEWLSSAYNIYKKTVRNATITMFLYGNIGTAVRNYVDSSSKGMFETLQYDQDAVTYIKRYMQAVSDVHEYSNIYREIEDSLGTVNRETIAKYFDGDIAKINKFNILYGYEHTCGGDSVLQELTIKQTRDKAAEHFTKDTNIDKELADKIRKNVDAVYSYPKYYGLTKDQLKNHAIEIHDKCMERLQKRLKLDSKTLAVVDSKLWDYNPTVLSWGDQMARFPILGFNKGRFNNAEVRARLAVYQTFLEGGSSEYEAMQHVTATQFHYAGIGKVEDVMPFTQYKLYNALYWFDHANANAVKTAWRAAQYNGDGYSTNKEIADLCTKYRQKDYYLYDKGVDTDYDRYYEGNLRLAEHIFLDGVDSYLGVPREFNAGNLDLNGTHYLKLGNSFVEEIDMVTTFAVGAVMLSSTLKDHLTMGRDLPEKVRYAYESFKYTPLYDSLYSPWKSYADLVAYAYDHKFTSLTDAYKDFMANRSTHSEAIMALSCVGAVLTNLVGRMKSFDLNVGELAALTLDPYAKQELGSYMRDMFLDIAGMTVPSLVGTKVDPEEQYNAYTSLITKNFLKDNPTTYFDMLIQLQRMGFTEDQADAIWDSIKVEWNNGSFVSKRDYLKVANDLFAKGYTLTEITNVFQQHGLPSVDNKRFLAMWYALPGYIKYDNDMRRQIIDYYKSMGMSTEEAWAMLINHPVTLINGKLVELSPTDVAILNKRQSDTYWSTHSTWLTDEEWDAYWQSLRELGYYYPKGKWSETYHYLTDAGFTAEAARSMLLHGYMLDANGKLVDVQGQARAYTFYKYDYSRPLGYENFNAYYQTLPDYIKYEKGAFSRTYQALKSLGFKYDMSLRLIQQGAYLMDASAVPLVLQTLGAKRDRAGENTPVTDIVSLLRKYGGTIIKGVDGKDYMLIDCSGLQRPRKRYSYSGGSYSRGGYSRSSGRSWINYYSKRKPRIRYSQYYTRKPFVLQGNVSSFAGFTGYRGKTPDKLTKPYTTKGYVSTYSLQNFLNGASYGMRKAYKIDMRQFKSGALSTKSAYPASYRNIAVAYRRNLYKDLYAKYGASRMRMRSNQPGYSNASITRLRRNEIYNRERYAERRDRKAQEKQKVRAAR